MIENSLSDRFMYVYLSSLTESRMALGKLCFKFLSPLTHNMQYKIPPKSTAQKFNTVHNQSTDVPCSAG